MKRLKFVHNKWFVIAVSFLLGALLILVIRFFAYSPEQVHYHANFAVYINGQREEFKNPVYYQEVAACSATSGITAPQQRAHMHDEINSVVHVHDHAVTWGQFFENLGWYVAPDFLETSGGAHYIEGGSNKVNIILNGQDYTDLGITNKIIGDKDRLLISFGSISSAELQKEFKSVPNTAAKYDAGKDPASCQGTEKITAQDRIDHLFQ